MGFFDFFRRPSPIADRAVLMEFLDSQSAFLAQKGVFEYSRARAGPYGNILFKDKGFLAAVETSRWIAYPLCLMIAGEAIEGVLREAADHRAKEIRRAFAAVMLAVFDRYDVPAAVDAVVWQNARDEIAREFDAASLHPIRRIIDIPARYVERYVAAMPIHEKLIGKDAPTIHNYLKANLCHVHDVFLQRVDIPSLLADLAGERVR